MPWRRARARVSDLIRLEQLLDDLDVGVAPFAICEVRGETGLVLPDDDTASLHYILSGTGLARPATGPDIPLAPHTVMIAPPAAGLTVLCGDGARASFPPPRCEPLPGGWEHATVGTGAPGLVMACGAVRATHRQSLGLFDYLREPLVDSVAGEVAFRDAFRLLLTELAAPKPGTRALAATLMKQCLIVLLRRLSENGECRAPWLAALEHPQLGAAVAAMLDRPETSFTLQGLADIAGMSRAGFAQHFKEAFGRPAMEFLKEVRLRRAAHLLAATDLPVKTVAARVGFSSRSYFTRAFTTFAGDSPACYRAASESAPEERRIA